MTKKSIKKTVKMTLPDYWGVNKSKSNNKFISNKKLSAKGSDWFGNNVHVSKKPSKSKKNMNYKEAHTYFGLSPIGDADGDKVPNWRDCKPFDRNRQGAHLDAFKAKLSAMIPKPSVATESSTEPTQTTLDDFTKSKEDIAQEERALQRKQQRQELYQKAKTAAVGYVKRKGAEMEANYQQQMQKMQQPQQTQQPYQQAQRMQNFQGFPGNVSEQQPRQGIRLAPGMIEYRPVSKNQVTFSRQLLRAPFQDQPGQPRPGDMNPSRPTGIMPLVRFHKLRFGRY